MGVYSNYGSVMESTTDLMSESIDLSDIIDPDNYATQIMYENNTNLYNIMKATGIYELHEIEHNGEILNESGFISKIKAFFQKLWEKIKKFFKNLIIKIQGLFMNGKKFAKKYDKQINRIIVPKDFSYKGYTFTHMDWKCPDINDIKIDGTSAAAWLKEFIDHANNGLESMSNQNSKKFIEDYDPEDDKEKARYIILHQGTGTGSIESGEWKREVFEYFRNGESSRETIDTRPDLQAMKSYMIDESKATKAVNDNYKILEKAVKAAVKDANELDKKMSSFENDRIKAERENDPNAKVESRLGYASQYVAIYTKKFNNYSEIALSVCQALNQAIADRAKQSRSVISALLTRKEVKESADFGITHSDPYEVELV